MQTDDKCNDDMLAFARKNKRRSRYEYKKAVESGVMYCGTDSDFLFSYAMYKLWLEEEQQKKSYQALYEALEDLKLIDPAGHKLVIEYYFSEGKVTFTQIGKKHGISRQACSKKIRKCLNILKSLVKLHKCR